MENRTTTKNVVPSQASHGMLDVKWRGQNCNRPYEKDKPRKKGQIFSGNGSQFSIEHGSRTNKKMTRIEITLGHLTSLLNWALAHEDCTLDGWKMVILSDEINKITMNSDGIK